jgi:hypothetical protein
MGQRAASVAAAVDAVDDPEGALQAVIAAGFGEIFDVSKNPSVTAVQAAINAKGPGEVVRIGPGTVNMTAQLDAHMRGTSTSTPLALASAGTARPGRVVNNRFSTSSTPLVMLSRALPGEIIEGNTFVGVAFSAAGLASTGRGVVRGNMSIDVTVGSHLDSTPPRCSPKPAPRGAPGRGSAATRSSTAPRSPGRSSARCASPPAHHAPGRATGPSRRDPSS